MGNCLQVSNAISAVNSECLRCIVLDTEQPGRMRETKRKIVEMTLNRSGVRDTARVLRYLSWRLISAQLH